MKRREFIAGSLGTAFLMNACSGADGFSPWKGKRLVLIQLVGGHDGLFALNQRGISEVEKRRPVLTAEFERQCLDLGNDWALNLRLSALEEMIQSKELYLVPGVGYANPNTSHFKAREFWDSGLLPAETNASNRLTGWLGRAYESNSILNGDRTEILAPFLNLHNGQTVYDKGRSIRAIAYTDEQALEWYSAYFSDYKGQIPVTLREYERQLRVVHGSGSLVGGRGSLVHGRGSLVGSSGSRGAGYGFGELGRQLETAAGIIGRDLPYPVLHCSLGGFDTHSGEIERLTDLYQDFSGALSQFRNDLVSSGHWKDTLVFVYSDFGRTIDENRSGGTDHGYSGMCMFAGGDLSLFDQYSSYLPSKFIDRRGELFLEYQIDFREILGGVREWVSGIG
jgi:uncharacterized protein (DUF1501 family)